MTSYVVYRFYFLLEINFSFMVFNSDLWPSVTYRRHTIKYLCQIRTTCDEIRNR
jgi:hypothetical protein